MESIPEIPVKQPSPKININSLQFDYKTKIIDDNDKMDEV